MPQFEDLIYLGINNQLIGNDHHHIEVSTTRRLRDPFQNFEFFTPGTHNPFIPRYFCAHPRIC